MTIALPAIPTLGFETKRCYAKDVYKALAEIELPRTDRITIAYLRQRHMREIWWMSSMNMNKAAGYIPGISTIAGISRLAGFTAAVVGDLPFKVDSKVSFVARAALDICCLGWVLIPVDVYATRARETWAIAEFEAASRREREAADARPGIMATHSVSAESGDIDEPLPDDEVTIGQPLQLGGQIVYLV